jgi:hypothetical protein
MTQTLSIEYVCKKQDQMGHLEVPEVLVLPVDQPHLGDLEGPVDPVNLEDQPHLGRVLLIPVPQAL